MFVRKEMSSTPANLTVSVDDAETWEKQKKFTVYKVIVNCEEGSWFVFRRYNEFHKLCETVKKQFPQLQLKLPGKKYFGNNLDPAFVESRREGLDAFIQKLASCEKALQLHDVRAFLLLDHSKTTEEKYPATEEVKDDKVDGVNQRNIDLGPSERPQGCRKAICCQGVLSVGALDMHNIDPEFTKEPVPSSVGMSQSSVGDISRGIMGRRISSGYCGVFLSNSIRDIDDCEAFAGFSYAPPNETLS
ncbi:hypothetical protein J437_LFUL010890 [Ladona fulva]|uniref:PX domain-containing protein n=1 Tax=Ladona fulva TaxID=123851 RepID=A0A8K0KGM8_LADFU|nr:hypothetical protein J437_LFUL010890 [Ladona fulva]